MFLTATARDSESMAEDGEERFGTNFTFAKDRRSSGQNGSWPKLSEVNPPAADGR